MTPDAPESSAAPSPAEPTSAFLLGARVQGLLLGVPLFLALLRLMAMAEGTRLFRYQGF